eukprot:m.255399 g.255399  ORF g.255399 m.255399 type:complete len:161 (+) comp15500_c0_seq3:96-578(+)
MVWRVMVLVLGLVVQTRGQPWCESSLACVQEQQRAPQLYQALGIGSLLAKNGVVWVRSSARVQPPRNTSVPMVKISPTALELQQRRQTSTSHLVYASYSSKFKFLLIRNLKAGSSTMVNLAFALWNTSSLHEALKANKHPSQLTQEQRAIDGIACAENRL